MYVNLDTVSNCTWISGIFYNLLLLLSGGPVSCWVLKVIVSFLNTIKSYLRRPRKKKKIPRDRTPLMHKFFQLRVMLRFSLILISLIPQETIQRTQRNQDTSQPKVSSETTGFPSKTIFPFRLRQNIDSGSD